MGFSAPLRFTVRTDVRNGVARLALTGELDMAGGPVLEAQLERFANDGVAATLLDLRELTFMDSTGLGVLVRATKRAKQLGHPLAVVGVGGAPRRVLELTATEGILVDEARGLELIRRFTQSEAEAPRAEAVSSRDE